MQAAVRVVVEIICSAVSIYPIRDLPTIVILIGNHELLGGRRLIKKYMEQSAIIVGVVYLSVGGIDFVLEAAEVVILIAYLSHVVVFNGCKLINPTATRRAAGACVDEIGYLRQRIRHFCFLTQKVILI